MEKKIQALGWFHASGEMFSVSISIENGNRQYKELCAEITAYEDRVKVKLITITWEE